MTLRWYETEDTTSKRGHLATPFDHVVFLGPKSMMNVGGVVDM